MRLPELIGKEAATAFAATVTDDGTVSAERLLLRLTTAPPDPAALDSVTVQFALALAPNVAGLHCREETTAGATKDTVEERDAPLYVAVTMPF